MKNAFIKFLFNPHILGTKLVVCPYTYFSDNDELKQTLYVMLMWMFCMFYLWVCHHHMLQCTCSQIIFGDHHMLSIQMSNGYTMLILAIICAGIGIFQFLHNSLVFHIICCFCPLHNLIIVFVIKWNLQTNQFTE